MKKSDDWKYEKMKLIKEVLGHKHILPIYVQNKLMKEINFQIKALGNKSISPIKNRTRRLKTVEQSPKKIRILKSGSFIQNDNNECMICRKYNFLNEVIIQCNTETHMFHEKCIQEHFKDQCNQNYKHLFCPCGVKLCPERVKQFKIKGIEEMVEFFLNQQLQIIANMISIQKCRNQLCKFFWISNQKKTKFSGRQLKPLSKYYCPNC